MTENDDATPAEGEETTPADIEVVDPEPEPTSNGTVAIRNTDEWVEPDQDWPYEWLDIEGDRLAVRKPTQNALAGFSLASSRHLKPEKRNDITGLFIANHLSEESWSRVFSRLMDPDEKSYTEETVGALMRAIVELRTNSSSASQDSAAQ